MKTPPLSDLIYAEHASDIIAKGAELAKASRPFALITSLAIEGGAAREVGSLAIVEASGQMTGYLSNGCIDRDIQHHALEALQSQQKKLIRYGDGSRFADLKLPCGGALTVLIDPAPDTKAIMTATAQLAARASHAEIPRTGGGAGNDCALLHLHPTSPFGFGRTGCDF